MTKSVAWLDVLFPVPYWERGSYSSEKTGDVGPETVFAFYLEDQVDKKLAINGVNSAHCWLQRRPNAVSLTRCCSSASRKGRLLSAITRLIFLRIRYVRWDYAMITILPRALGTEVLFPR